MLEIGERLDHQPRADIGEAVVKLARRLLGRNRDTLGEANRTGVEPLAHMHDGDPGFGIARHDGALDRRGTAPARQQRGMDMKQPSRGASRIGRGEQEAIGDDHGGIGFQVAER